MKLSRGSWCPSCYQLDRQNRVIITPKLREIIDGLLLGDGSCLLGDKGAKCSYILYSCTSSLDTIAYISQILQGNGINQCGKIYQVDKKSGIPRSRYNSRCYRDLNDINDKWYLHDRKFCPLCEIYYQIKQTNCSRCNTQLARKIIPRDIQITPTTLFLWFIGDGNYQDKPVFTLHTNAFLREDNKFLKSKLAEIGLELNYYKHNILSTSKKYIVKRCFEYMKQSEHYEKIKKIYSGTTYYKNKFPEDDSVFEYKINRKYLSNL